MKKLILLVYLSALMLSYSYSQNLPENISNTKIKPNYKIKILTADPISNPFKKPVLNLRQSKGITMTEISSSGNAYTLLFPESRCLSADQYSGEIMFSHRGNPLAGVGKSINNIVQSISADNGSTWKNIVVTGDTTKPNRYPSGVIYNSSRSSSNANLY